MQVRILSTILVLSKFDCETKIHQKSALNRSCHIEATSKWSMLIKNAFTNVFDLIYWHRNYNKFNRVQYNNLCKCLHLATFSRHHILQFAIHKFITFSDIQNLPFSPMLNALLLEEFLSKDWISSFLVECLKVIWSPGAADTWLQLLSPLAPGMA